MLSEQDILTRIAATIERSLKNGAVQSPITRQTTAHDVQGWDSLTHAVLMMAVEQEFGVELPLEETLDMENVGDLVDLVRALAV